LAACCQQCLAELPAASRPKSFCSARCRAAWHRHRHEAERAARERDLHAQLADSLRREQEARAALDGVRRLAEIALALLADGRETSGEAQGS